MNQYDSFIFDSYAWDPLKGTIELRYSLDDHMHFTETLTLPPGSDFPREIRDPQAFNRALFALHIIGGISYYKTCLPKKLVIRSGTLTDHEATFWNGVYENGLGEFFFKNNIDFEGLIQFPFDTQKKEILEASQPETRNPKRILVPIGGGKDSLVTAELLRKSGSELVLFRMGHHPLIDELARIAELPLLTIKRALSPKLFELNEQGALNGHVPISAYLSCVTVIMSLLYGFDAIAMSNERSANEGNVEFKGKEINHQWSKSLEFEKDFQAFLEYFVTPNIAYFSLLRPLSELHITKLLTQHSRYFKHFTSCNKNWTILAKKSDQGRWCGKCPKCAFAFALLAAFVDRETLEKIFGGIFFDNPELQTFYRELLGLEGFKPFECVGTVEETSAAFLLAHQRGDLEDTAAMKTFIKDVLPKIKKPDALIKEMLTPVAEHAVPEAFQKSVPRG